MSKPVAIVTGGASGIGLAITKHLLKKGIKVCLADSNEIAGKRVSSKLGPDAMFVHCDITDDTSQATLFARAFEWGGQRLDLLAANAGINDSQSLYTSRSTIGTSHIQVEGLGEVEVPLPINLKTIEVDLTAVIQALWLFRWFNGKSQHGKGGKVVVTSSSAGIYPLQPLPQYTAAKHGLIGLVRAAGPVLLKEDDITLNAIVPGFLTTNLIPKHLGDAMPTEHITPLSTILKVYDMFLEDASTTGQTVECSQDNHFFRQPVEYPNESQRWLIEDSAAFFESLLTEAGT